VESGTPVVQHPRAGTLDARSLTTCLLAELNSLIFAHLFYGAYDSSSTLTLPSVASTCPGRGARVRYIPEGLRTSGSHLDDISGWPAGKHASMANSQWNARINHCT